MSQVAISGLLGLCVVCSSCSSALLMMGGEETSTTPTSPGPSPPPPPSFTESCKDLRGTYGDNETVTTLDECKASCSGNTHDHNFTCKGIIYQQISDRTGGKPFCRLYDNKDLDSSVDICPSGLKSYTLK